MSKMKYEIKDIIKRYDAEEQLEYVFFWGHHGKDGQVTNGFHVTLRSMELRIIVQSNI